MKTRVVAAVALLSAGLSGCVIDPSMLGGMNLNSPAEYAYQQPGYAYQPSTVYVYQQPPRAAYGLGYSRVDVYGSGRRFRDHDDDGHHRHH
ncbi:MAG: hypothetical protein ACM3W4_04410 [Ignavibacteriales bacterium]